MHKNKRYILPILLGVGIGASLYAISIAQAWSVKQNPPRQKVAIKSAPEVVSCVKSIRVKNRTINDAGTPQANVSIEVENMSDLGIIAISLESKKGHDTYAVRPSTFQADEPTVLIEPHETYTLRMELSNVFPNAPLQIGSVMYVDGTEAGCQKSLKAMRNSKTRHEQLKAERKGSFQ